MTPLKRKVLHAMGIAVTTFAINVGQQLSDGRLSLTKAALAGVLIGLIARAVGAGLARIAMPDATAAAASSDGGPGG